MGHPNEMVANAISYNITVCQIEAPRLVTSINEPDARIDSIDACDGATVCLGITGSKQVLHLFNDYKSRRIFYMKETGSPLKKV